MKTSVLLFGIGMFTLVILVGCGPQPSIDPADVSHGGSISDHISFVDHLRSSGITVEIIDDVQQPFLQAKGTGLRISGGDIEQPAEVQSYNYDDVEAAEADVNQIGPDGNPKTAKVNWSEPPHWFRKERVIVLYLGNDQAVLNLLTELLGPQFAGQ